MERAILRGLLLVLLFASPAAAHDMWIEPSTFEPRAGELVELRLKVGHPGQEEQIVRRDDARILRFVVASGEDEAPVLGLGGAEVAGILRPEGPGVRVVGYHTTPLHHDMSPTGFHRYLAEEGLESIQALRRERGEADERATERYWRCLKSLLVSEGGGDGGTVTLGLPLEIVPEIGPEALRAGAALPLQVLFEGAPAAGLLVRARHLDGEAPEVVGRSGSDGRASLTLPRGGRWVVTAVSMRRAPAEADVQWESFWSSLSFALPEAAPEEGQAAGRAGSGTSWTTASR